MASRDKTTIIADILRVAVEETQREGSALKTHIMYKANLSHRQLTKYLQILTNEDMLRENVFDGRYVPTDSASLYLQDYERLSRHFSPPKKEIQTQRQVPALQVPLVMTYHRK